MCLSSREGKKDEGVGGRIDDSGWVARDVKKAHFEDATSKTP